MSRYFLNASNFFKIQELQDAEVQEENHHFADIEDTNNQENIVNERNKENIILKFTSI